MPPSSIDPTSGGPSRPDFAPSTQARRAAGQHIAPVQPEQLQQRLETASLPARCENYRGLYSLAALVAIRSVCEGSQVPEDHFRRSGREGMSDSSAKPRAHLGHASIMHGTTTRQRAPYEHPVMPQSACMHLLRRHSSGGDQPMAGSRMHAPPGGHPGPCRC